MADGVKHGFRKNGDDGKRGRGYLGGKVRARKKVITTTLRSQSDHGKTGEKELPDVGKGSQTKQLQTTEGWRLVGMERSVQVFSYGRTDSGSSQRYRGRLRRLLG